ncbi:MAG: hypothetical protein ACLSF7_09260 [Acutalibacteraceae bacterium]
MVKEDLKEELIYISDFYAGIGKMSKSVQLNLADALASLPAAMRQRSTRRSLSARKARRLHAR